MGTSWPDNLSYKHASARKPSSDTSRRGANSRYQVQEHRSNASDWPWSRPQKSPESRTRPLESQTRRRDETTTSNRQKPSWEQEGVKAAREYLSRHSGHDMASTATPSLWQRDEKKLGETTKDQSWLRSFASQLIQEEANAVPATLPLKTAYEEHYGPSSVSNFLSNEPLAVHTVTVPGPTTYFPPTSERTSTSKAPSAKGSFKLIGARTPPRNDSPTPLASPKRNSADGRTSPCSVSLDVALKDMYETLRRAHTLFSSYQTTFEEGAGSVIGRFKEAPLNLAWRDMLAEQFNTDTDKRQFEAVTEGLGTRTQAVTASLHEHTSAPRDDAYHLEGRARAARKVVERMEEVTKLERRAREERMACKFLLEEMDELMAMLDPKTHPRLYSDMEEKRWVGVSQERDTQSASRKTDSGGTKQDRGPKKSGSVRSDDGKRAEGIQGEAGNAISDEVHADQSWSDKTDNTDSNAASGYNGKGYQHDNDNDDQRANNDNRDTNWEAGDDSRAGNWQENTGR